MSSAPSFSNRSAALLIFWLKRAPDSSAFRLKSVMGSLRGSGTTPCKRGRHWFIILRFAGTGQSQEGAWEHTRASLVESTWLIGPFVDLQSRPWDRAGKES